MPPSDPLRHQSDGDGPVPVDGMPGLVFPTWRHALVDAYDGIAAAYDRRRRVTQAAVDAGLTFAQIAEAVGLSPAGVHKIVGRQRPKDADELLDSPAGIEIVETRQECDGSGGFGPSEGSGLLGWSRCPGCAKCKAEGANSVAP